jgi:hypothetical protein
MTFRIDRVEAWGHTGNQIIVYLVDERTGSAERPDGTSYCVRITLPEAPGIITELMTAYAAVMQNVATELACGGCRTCKNTRFGTDGERCKVCWPRGERRIREKAFLAPPRRHSS